MAMHQHHHHQHVHGHDHHTHHADPSNIKVAFFLNTAFTIIELFGGLYTNSLAIMSDALHDLGDSLSLGLAWFFQRLSQKGRDTTFSYGYRRFSLLGAIVNSIILIVGSIFIIQEAIPRIISPEQADAKGMIALAILGIIVNGAAAFRLSKGTSLNEKVVSMHLLEDVMGWVAVLVASVVMLFADVPILDPILSLLIASYILFNVYKSLKASMKIVLQAIPDHINIEQLEDYVLDLPNVSNVHDVHLWSLDGEFHVLSMHIVLEAPMSLADIDGLKQNIRKLVDSYHVHHATIEVHGPGETCKLNDHIADDQPHAHD